MLSPRHDGKAGNNSNFVGDMPAFGLGSPAHGAAQPPAQLNRRGSVMMSPHGAGAAANANLAKWGYPHTATSLGRHTMPIFELSTTSRFLRIELKYNPNL